MDTPRPRGSLAEGVTSVTLGAALLGLVADVSPLRAAVAVLVAAVLLARLDDGAARRLAAVALIGSALGVMSVAVRLRSVRWIDALTHTAIRLTSVARWIHPRRRAS